MTACRFRESYTKNLIFLCVENIKLYNLYNYTLVQFELSFIQKFVRAF